MVRGAGRGVTGLVLFLAACTGSSSTSPATAPNVTPTQAQATSAATTTPTAPPTTLAPSTTIDRLAEIEAIFADLEFRRLDALYRNDEEAFRALFANEAFLEVGLDALELELPFATAPMPTSISLPSFQVLIDRSDCLAANFAVDSRSVLDVELTSPTNFVLTRRPDGEWGYAFVGTGWLCDGPHPLDNA